jgi:hypothetical protein
MTGLAESLTGFALAVNKMVEGVSLNTRSLETAAVGQTAIALTTQSTDSKVNAILTIMRESGVKVEDILVGMGLIGINVQKLAEFAIRPTPAAQQEVKEIADQKPDKATAPAPVAAPEVAAVPA